MQMSKLKPLAPWMLWLGVAGLVAAGIIAFIVRQFDTSVQVALVIGLLGLALAVLFDPGAVAQWAGGRQAKYGANTFVMVVALIGIVVLVNYLVQQLPSESRFYDWSEGQLNTLPPEAAEAVKQLPQPVKAIGFYTSQSSFRLTSDKEVFDRFREVAPDKFSYEFIDPQADPVRARNYDITTDGTVILEMGDQRQELSFVSDTEVASALVRLANPVSRTVYFLTGEGEADFNDTGEFGISRVAELLKDQNYTLQPLNLLVTTTIPADARAIVIAGPQVPLAQQTVETLRNYLNTNTDVALVVMLDPVLETRAEAGQVDALAEYLASDWGIVVRDDVVIDLYNSAFTQQGQNVTWPFNNGYEASPITAKLENIPSVFPLVRSISTTVGTGAITYTPLVKTDGRAWGETDLEALSASTDTPAAGPDDNAGPLTVALAAEDTARKVRLVVFGDSSFAQNQIVGGGQTANGPLFVGSVNWALKDESLIDLTPRTPTQRSIQPMDALTGNGILFVVVILMPALVLVMGGVVWFMRRRHV
jgi:ABC-type uncharacterized transport system involved in gliding motility auxiliary subunit